MAHYGFMSVPTDSWEAFYNAVKPNGYNTDGKYGEQCWDAGDLFWRNAVGRGFSTGGTGRAKGCWEAARGVNAGSEFDLIVDKGAIQPGDWVVFGGEYGHVGMAISGNMGGYVQLLGQNQSGNDPSKGWPFSVINMSLNKFLGAFRLKKWHPAPAPTPPPTKTIDELAHEVLAGKWGNMPERQQNLEAAGYDYYAVQARVNELLAPSQPVLPPAPVGPQVGDLVTTTATTDIQSGVKLNLNIINDGQSVFASVNSKGNAVLKKGGVVRCAVAVDSLVKV